MPSKNSPLKVLKWYVNATTARLFLPHWKTLIIGRPVFFMCVIGDAGFQGDSSVQMSPDEMSPASSNYDHFCRELARSTKIWTLFSRLKKKKQVVKTEADPARHCFSSPFTVKVKLWQLQPTLNYAGSRQGDHYVTSAAPPSAGKLIACSSVWLALNERMWVTMSFSPGAMTVGGWGVGGGRSWIWNNETVNALHHNYWFPQVYILCPWFSSTTVTVHT